MSAKTGKTQAPNPALDKINALETKMGTMGSVFSLIICFIVIFFFVLIVVWVLHPRVSNCPDGGQNMWINIGIAAFITVLFIILLCILKALNCLSWCSKSKLE